MKSVYLLNQHIMFYCAVKLSKSIKYNEINSMYLYIILCVLYLEYVVIITIWLALQPLPAG